MPGQQRTAPRTEHAIRQIKHVLVQDFSDLIDMSDYEKKQPEDRQRALYSRSLAALAVRGLTGSDNEQAAACLIDGRDDHGIDAIAVSETAGKIWLVQSKWNRRGQAGLKQGEALKFLRGWRLLENRDFDRFNERIQEMSDKINAVLLGPHTRVHFVVALTGDGELHPDISGVFDEVFAETNGFGLTLDLQVMGTQSLWEQIRAERAPEDIPITATMRQWIYVKTPVEMYQGIVSTEQVAKWVGEAGEGLFHRNIRASLGTTDVNAGILESLSSDPEHFLFFHNGITVICGSVETKFPGPRRPNEPVILTMHGASVVNGAQSVSTLHRLQGTPTPCPKPMSACTSSVSTTPPRNCPLRSPTPATARTEWKNETSSPLMRFKRSSEKTSGASASSTATREESPTPYLNRVAPWWRPPLPWPARTRT